MEVVISSNSREHGNLLSLFVCNIFASCFLNLTGVSLFQSSEAPEGCGFVRWVDPPPIYPH